MPLVAPNLDQRTFDQLVAEVRRRIPTLTPEWTDLNEGDPGITLAELFAFMTEQLLFQVNQVPEKGFITFLKMVGVELHPAAAAIADVTFTAKPATDAEKSTKFFELGAGTRIQTSGPPPGQRQPVTFETTKPLSVLNGALVDLVSSDCTLTFQSHKNANDSLTQSFQPFGKASSTQDFFYLVLRLDTPDQVFEAGALRFRVNLAGSKDVGDPPPVEFDAGIPKRIQWSFASGTTVAFDGTVSLEFENFDPTLDSTNEFTQSGYLEFTFNDLQAAGFFRGPAGVEPDFFEGFFVLRAQLARDDAFQGLPIPSINTVRLNTAPAKAVQTVQNEFVGASSGLPFQRFRLANAPVIPGSTLITVDESAAGGGAAEEWHEIEDLFAAGPNDRVYQLFPATGDVLFGDGVFGKIPPPDDGTLSGNIVAASYQFGGGLSGNVGAQTLTNVTTVDTHLPQFDATNVLSAGGGADEEAVDQGLARAPAVVRSRFRAVTAEDFEALARETPEVRVDRAFALASTRPGVTPGLSPGSVTVLLVPHVTFEDSIHAPIELQPHVAAAVLRFLDERRLITTEVFTAPPTFRKITVSATLVLEPRASAADTRSATLDALHRFFHALVGGNDGLGWPFGGTIFFSRVIERLLAVDGVARAENVALSLDDGPFVECRDVQIRQGELLFSGQHVISVQAGG